VKSRNPRTKALFAALAAGAALAASAAAGSAAATAPGAHLTSVKVTGSTLAIRGRAAFADGRRHPGATVLLTLVRNASSLEHKRVRVRNGRFSTSWRTSLRGPLTLAARLHLGRRGIGPAATREVTVGTAGVATTLVGLFKLDPGSAPGVTAPTGSYFEMISPSGSPVSNLTSPAPDKTYTPFTPGTDGGLRTDAYQEPPSPAFAEGNTGSALAHRIIQPVSFESVRFSIVTAATDPQLGVHDPLPAIVAQDGRLSGQLSAWNAQWNGQSFNQGSPKPNGSYPPPTTPLYGTYDAATGRFKLAWKSRIVGGPFNGFTGVWHLAGTFVPASSKGGGGGLPKLPPLL
jgi:hypothetical protein